MDIKNKIGTIKEETKKEIARLNKINGEVKGVVFQTDIDYILRKKGEDGLKSFNKAIKEAAIGIKMDEIKAMNWYPVGWRGAFLLIAKDVLGFSEKDIKDMGRDAPKLSFLARLFFHFFLPTRKMVNEVPDYWNKHYSIGKLEVVKFSEKEKIAILQISNINIHPLFCLYLEGYFETVTKMTRPNDSKVTVTETNCPLKGDKGDYHQYLIEWTK